MSYHNTNKLSGKELAVAEKQAKTQDEKINDIIREYPSGLTASEVHKVYPSKNTLITSIRRAMTNLCTQGKVFKTSSMKISPYGRPEHIYAPIKECKNCQNCDCLPK